MNSKVWEKHLEILKKSARRNLQTKKGLKKGPTNTKVPEMTDDLRFKHGTKSLDSGFHHKGLGTLNQVKPLGDSLVIVKRHKHWTLIKYCEHIRLATNEDYKDSNWVPLDGDSRASTHHGCRQRSGQSQH